MAEPPSREPDDVVPVPLAPRGELEPSLTGQELCDVLWLASRPGFGDPAVREDAAEPADPGAGEHGSGTGPTGGQADRADDRTPPDQRPGGSEPADGPDPPSTPKDRAPRAEGDAPDRPKPPVDIPGPPGAGTRGDEPGVAGGRHIWAPLSGPGAGRSGERELLAALRPLRQRAGSAHEQVMDEDATAERLAQGRHWPPVMAAGEERRWDLAVVVDNSPSMAVWTRTVADFAATVQVQATFRDVRLWWFDTADPDRLRLRTSAHGVAVGTGSLVDISTRRIVLVLTDGGAEGWYAGTVPAVLAEWAHTMTVAVVHMLPQSSWPHTAIQPVRVLMRAVGRGSTTAGMFWSPVPAALDAGGTAAAHAVAIPVLALEPQWLHRWARVVAGRVHARLPALIVPPGAPAARTVEQVSADQLLNRFRSYASPLTVALASRLAAAPLNLFTMAAVQRLVPRTGPQHLSEILASGLLQPVSPPPDVAGAAQITFDFVPGVREELLALSGRTRTLEVVAVVERELGETVESVRGLTARVSAPEAAARAVDSDESMRNVEHAVIQALWGAADRTIQAQSASTGVATPKKGIRHETSPKDSGAPTPVETEMSERITTHGQDIISPASLGDPGSIAAGRGADPRIDEGYQPGGPRVTSTTADAPPTRERRALATPSVLGNIPPRNPNFTGREALLDLLHRRLQTGMTAVLPEALHGMGGVGKTQLVVEYVYRELGQSNYDLIWWIPAERPAQIQSALVELAQRLDLPVASTANTAVPAVREALRLGRPYANWLLIFDNAESPAEVQKFFPISGPGSIIVTSRNSGWSRMAHSLEVDVFERPESIKLLTRRGPQLTDDEANQLAEALGDLPLAIEQAAAWRAETGMSAQEYLRLLAEYTPDLLDDDGIDDRPVGYPTSVAAAWTVSLNNLKTNDPVALRLLQVCAFFAPEPISRPLLSSARGMRIDPELDKALRDPVLLGRAIRTINRYALARIDHRTNSIQMHRLVQRVLIQQMTVEERAAIQHGAHLMLAANDPNQPDSPDHWTRYQELYPHIIASGAIDCQDAFVRDLIQNEAKFLWRWGDHPGARDMSMSAYKVWRDAKELGEKHPDTLKMASWLGFMHFVASDYAAAATLNARTYELYVELLGEDREETLSAMGAVAADLRVAGDFAAALERSSAVYRRSLVQFGIDEPFTLRAAHNLAVSLRLSGQFDKALELDEQTRQRMIEIYGSDHPDTLQSDGGLNLDRRELGDYVGARERQERLVAAFRGLMKDDDHPDVLRQSNELAVVRRRAGDHQGALTLSSDVHRRFLSRYGPDHPDTVLSALNESLNLRTGSDRNLRVAREIGERVVSQLRGIYGSTHPHTVAGRVNLAVTLRLLGDAAGAFTLDEESFAQLEQRLGTEHILVLSCGVNLASDLHALEDFQAAHDSDVEMLERSRRLLGESHPTTLACEANLSLDLRALNRTGEADALLADTLARFRSKLGNTHPATIGAAGHVRANCDIDPMPL